MASDENFVAFTAILAVMTGLIALLAGLLKLGFVANFISEPVLKGFIIGLALTIIVGQLPKLFGIEGGEGDFFEKLSAWIAGLGETDVPTLAVGLISLAIVLVLRAYWHRSGARPDSDRPRRAWARRLPDPRRCAGRYGPARRLTPYDSTRKRGVPMAKPDPEILSRIGSLVDQERELRDRDDEKPLGEGERARLEELETELDQCWDLLNQRRALREFGLDPSSARIRDEDTVEVYQQ